MTIDEANKLKRGTALRVPNPDGIMQNARADLLNHGLDFNCLILEAVQRRSGESPLLCFERGTMYGLFAKDVEIADGPW